MLFLTISLIHALIVRHSLQDVRFMSMAASTAVKSELQAKGA
jgi:hypothetical protein